MISKNTIKLIKSLSIKKYRQKHKMFIVEGEKNVLEIVDSDIEIKQLIGTDDFLENYLDELKKVKTIQQATASDLNKASLLTTPQNCLALCALPDVEKLPGQIDKFSLFLDGIQDPGNLGTIIRTCDWYGIDHLFCSTDTVDAYNPKVIQSTMGSFSRVKLFYTDFEKLREITGFSETMVYGTFMDGQNIYNLQLPENTIVVLGNEGNGIRQNIERFLNQKISVPRFRKSGKPESLNVAVTAAIICSEFKRNETP